MMPATDVAAARGRRPKLADRLVDALRGRIRSGALVPGGRLPTEASLTTEFGVSRTVVREAIARLSADGLVTARQGAGIFVADPPPAGLQTLLAEMTTKVSMVLDVLEVRMAIEIEASALAALRRAPSQDTDIHAAFAHFDRALRRSEPTSAADFAFHRAIALATNNPVYVEVLDVLGRRTIPRDLLSGLSSEIVRSPDYQRRLHDEHRLIMNAISAGDADGARDAMRAHLSASQTRYRGMLRDGDDLADIFPAPAG